MAQGARKKAQWGWMLYDFASQPYHTLLITFIFAPYFVSAVADDPAQGQATWGYTTALAGLTIAALAPVLGAMADTSGPRRPWIIFFALFYIAGSASLWYALPGTGGTLFVLGAFAIGLIGVEFMTIFTNSMLPDLAEKDDIGRLSGSGWGFGYVGGLILLVIMLLFVAENEAGVTLLGTAPLFGLDPAMREGTRFVGPLTAIWFIVFMIPFFMWVPDAPRKAKVSGAVGRALRELVGTIKTLPQQPSLFAYLGSSMFYRDALNGFYAFGGIYAAGVLGWSVIDVGIFGILAGITGALGAWYGGRVDRRMGPRFVIFSTILILMVVCLVVLFTSRTSVLGIVVDAQSRLPDIAFYICGAMLGAVGGALQASSRTMLVHQVTNGRMTEAFGLYALTGKATAFLAPFLVALMTDMTGSQQMGMVPLIVMLAIGLLLLIYVKPVHALEAQDVAS
jgi:UMF1 family MFS transporter